MELSRTSPGPDPVSGSPNRADSPSLEVTTPVPSLTRDVPLVAVSIIVVGLSSFIPFIYFKNVDVMLTTVGLVPWWDDEENIIYVPGAVYLAIFLIVASSKHSSAHWAKPEELIDYPRLIHHTQQGTDSQELNPQLAVWHISGRDLEPKTFQNGLRTWSSNHGGQKQTNPMIRSLGDGFAGVVNGVRIPFQDP